MWKPSKESGFKSKVLALYGNNSDKYNFLLKVRETWVNQVTFVNEKALKNQADQKRKFTPITKSQLNLDDMKLETMTEEYIKEKFSRDISLELAGNGCTTDVPLVTGTPASLKSHTKRNAFAIATGGQILSIQWLPRNTDSDTSYFAVSVYNNAKGKPNAVDPEFSMFKRSIDPETTSAIQIWKYNFTTNDIGLENVLETSAFGAGYHLKWAPISTDEGVLGVLMGVFTDGNVHVFKITDSLPKYSKVSSSSLLYTIKNGSKGEKITCFDFIGTEKILAGSTDGAILEFMLPFNCDGDNNNNNNNDDDDLNVPNYKSVVCWSAIQNILCTIDNFGNQLCLVYTAAHRSLSFIYNNSLQDVFILGGRSHVQPGFNYVLQNMIIVNLPDQIQVSTPRNNHYTGTSLNKTDFYFTVCKVSEVLGHPFLLTGGANGSITIQNYMRKFLANRSTATKNVFLRLWKFATSPQGKLSLTSDVYVEQQESPVPPSATRFESCVSALSWNENLTGSSAFAAGVSGGVLLIERLDPEYL